MRLLFCADSLSGHKAGYLQAGRLAVMAVFSAFILSTPVQAGQSPNWNYADRSEAANPNNFKCITINGRGVSEAVAPCPISLGLINCALEKLALINLPPSSVHDDYDLVQTFYYPNTEHPKTAVVIAQATGLMDDSISGHRYRVSFKLEDANSANATWEFVQYGEQVQCARGDKAGRWVKRGCI